MSSMQFGQTGLSSTTMQPSQVSFIFDPSSQLFGTNQILGTSQTQNVNNSQLMGNHMVQPSHRPSGLQLAATPTTFYQQQPTLPPTPLQTPIQAQAPLQQTGFFPTQQNNTNLQVRVYNFHHRLKLIFTSCRGIKSCIKFWNESLS